MNKGILGAPEGKPEVKPQDCQLVGPSTYH
jgi:hypothetical protein